MNKPKNLPVSCEPITAEAVDGGRIILSLKELRIDLTGITGFEGLEVVETDIAVQKQPDAVIDAGKAVDKPLNPFTDLRYYATFSAPGSMLFNSQKEDETVVFNYLNSDHRSEFLSPRGVSIVILSGDNIKLLEKCLDSIEKNTDGAYEVLIWSNAKKVETIDFLKDISRYRFNSIVHVMSSEVQFNFATFNNNACTLARGDYVLFLNDDTEVHPGWLTEMKKRLVLDPSVGIVGAKLLSPDGKLQHMGMALKQPGRFYATYPFLGSEPDVWEASMDRDIGAVTGACMMVRRKEFFELDRFSEDYEQGFFEDSDLCMKMIESGKKVIYCSDAVVTHVFGASFGNAPTGYLMANEAKFRKKWGLKVENNIDRFKNVNAIYHPESILILDSFLDTAGGGERTVCELAKLLAEHYRVSIAISFQFDEKEIRKRLEHLLGYDLWGIDIINLSEAEDERDWDIFINGEWGSKKRGIGQRQNLYFTMFPHTARDYEFLNSYNLIVANSIFTQDYIKKLWNRDSEIIYPPVRLEDIAIVKTQERENIILSVGRFFPTPGSKKQEVLIRAFGELEGAEDWQLHLVGSRNKNHRQDVEYVENLLQIAAGNPNIFFHIDASKKELLDLYGRAKIFWTATGYEENNPITAEHFGISVVEALAHGLYPFVFDMGGQVEILNKIGSGRTWKTITELIKKTTDIIRAFGDKNVSTSLPGGPLGDCIEFFGIDRFRKQISEIISRNTNQVTLSSPQKKPSAIFDSWWSQSTSLGEISLCVARELQKDGWDVAAKGKTLELSKEELFKFDVVENPDIYFYHQIPIMPFVSQNENKRKIIFQMPCDATLLSDSMISSANIADLVITPSSHSQLVMFTSGVKSPIQVIPNWVDLSIFNMDTPRYDYGFSGIIIFVTGYFHYKKGLDILIPAFLEEFRGDEVLLVIKNSPVTSLENTDKEIRSMIKETEQIQYICEFMPKKQYASLLAGSDIVVTASRYEGFGIPLLEGLACGKTVVAPRFSGPLDFLNDSNAILYDIEGLEQIPAECRGSWFASNAKWAIPSKEHLKRALRRAVEEGIDPSRVDMQLETAAKYSKEIILNEYTKMFRDLLEAD